MTEFIRIVGRSLLLPLIVLPFGVGMMLIDGTIDLNFPFFEIGSLILVHMTLFFAIGLAVSLNRMNYTSRSAIVFAVVFGYVLVLLAVEATLEMLGFLAESTFLTEQWQTYAVIAGFFVVCYLFVFLLIRMLDLGDPSRRRRRRSSTSRLQPQDAAGSYIYALGGEENIVDVDNCATRLLVTVKDSTRVDSAQLKTLGVISVFKPSDTAVQITTGRDTEFIASAVRELLSTGNGAREAAPDFVSSSQNLETAANGPSNYDPAISASVLLMIEALGGAENIADTADIATTRLRIVVRDDSLVDEEALRAAGAKGVMPLGNTFHILLGTRAGAYAQEMQLRLEELRETA